LISFKIGVYPLNVRYEYDVIRRTMTVSQAVFIDSGADNYQMVTKHADLN